MNRLVSKRGTGEIHNMAVCPSCGMFSEPELLEFRGWYRCKRCGVVERCVKWIYMGSIQGTATTRNER